MIKQEDVTIIIPHLGATREQTQALIDCMMSLEDTFSGPIIIVTNGKAYHENMIPRYQGLIATRGQYHHIHVEDQGQCKAVNAAAATVNTPYIMISNDDMIYPDGWFERLTSTDAYCVSPVLVEPQPGAPTFLTHFCGGAGGDFDKKKFFEYVGQHYLSVKSHMKTGFNMPVLIKKELWDTIGGYDVNYDPWGSNSDSDLEYKIRLAGIQPMQKRDCLVYHFSQTSGTFNPSNDAARFKNYAYFKEVWGFERTDDRIWEADFPMPTKEEGRIFSPEWEGKYGN